MLLWYVCGLVLAAAVGWLAALCHLSGWAPVGIVSIAVGISLGVGVVKLAGLMGVNCRKRLLVGAIIFALAAILAEHAWLYRDFRRQWREVRERDPQVAIFRPETPWSPREYLQHEATGAHVALWCLDVTLVAAGALAVVMMLRPVVVSDTDKRKCVATNDANQSRPLTSDL